MEMFYLKLDPDDRQTLAAELRRVGTYEGLRVMVFGGYPEQHWRYLPAPVALAICENPKTNGDRLLKAIGFPAQARTKVEPSCVWDYNEFWTRFYRAVESVLAERTL